MNKVEENFSDEDMKEPEMENYDEIDAILMPHSNFDSKFLTKKDQQAGSDLPANKKILELPSREAKEEQKKNIIQKLLNNDNSKEESKKMLPSLILPKSKIVDSKPEILPQFEKRGEDPENPENVTQFKRAYERLAQKFHEQKETDQANILAPDEVNEAQESQIKIENTHNTIERLQEFNKKKIQKLDQKKDELEAKMLKECTFHPEIIRSEPQRRTIEDFLNDQKLFLEKRQENIIKKQEDQRAKLEMQYVGRPELAAGSLRLLNEKKKSDSPKEPIYEKLYHLKMKEKQNLLGDRNVQEYSKTNERNEESKFMPQIEERSRILNRPDRIDDHLYKDALRRQQKEKETEIESKRKKDQKKIDPNSQKYVARRFKKEFNKTLSNCEITKNVLEYEQFRLLLYLMGFINDSTEGEQNNSTTQLWRFIGGEAKGGVTKALLLNVLMAIMNILHVEHQANVPETIEEKKDEVIKSNKAKKITENIIQESTDFSESDLKEIHNTFHILYLNKISYVGKQNTSNAEKCSFEPLIDPNSEALAKKAREKLLKRKIEESKVQINDENNPDLKSIADLLVYQKQKKQEQLMKYKQERESKEIQECTFKPTISEYKPVSNQKENSKRKKAVLTSSILPSADRCNDLYLLSKKIKKTSDILPDQYILKKEEKEYTFKPNISKKEIALEPKSQNDKFTQQVIQRMKRGRELQELKKADLERNTGITSLKTDVEKHKYKSTFKGANLPKKGGNKSNTKKMNDSDHIQNMSNLPKNDKRKTENGLRDIDNQIKNFQTNERKYVSRAIPPLVNDKKKKDIPLESINNQAGTNIIGKPLLKNRILEEQKEFLEQNLMKEKTKEIYNPDIKTSSPVVNISNSSEQFSSVTKIKEEEPITKEEKQTKEEIIPITKYSPEVSPQKENENEIIESKEQSSSPKIQIKEQKALYNKKEFVNESPGKERQDIPTYEEEMDNNLDKDEGVDEEEQNEEEQHDKGSDRSSEKAPLLYIDVNLGNDESDRIVVYEGDSAEELAKEFVKKHELEEAMISKLSAMLEEQITNLLSKIDEANPIEEKSPFKS